VSVPRSDVAGYSIEMANAPPPIDNPYGSVWHRWEPHIHAPGTVLNDQYGGGTPAWDEFLSRVERADPPIRALGVTDYYSLQLYERAVEEKRKGRLSGIDLLFPNVEMRLAVTSNRRAGCFVSSLSGIRARPTAAAARTSSGWVGRSIGRPRMRFVRSRLAPTSSR